MHGFFDLSRGVGRRLARALVGLAWVLACLGAGAATTTNVPPTWGPWTPNADPVAYCTQIAASNGTAQYGWSNAGPVYAFTTTGQKATCYESCSGSQCGGSAYGVAGNSVINNRPATCATGDTWDITTGTCVHTVTDPGPGAGTGGGDDACSPLKGNTDWESIAGKAVIGQTSCSAIHCEGTWVSTVTYTNRTTGVSTTEGNFTFTGASCSPPTDPVNSPPLATPDTCKGGQYGEVNGVSKCIAYDPAQNTIVATKTSTDTTATTATPAASAASGAASSTTTTSSTPTTESTTCQGQQCTTTTTVVKTNADGSKTTTAETKDLTLDDLCQKYPKDPECVTKAGAFAGSCDAGFTCDGDAAACAIAKEQYGRNCTFFKTDQADVDKGTALRKATIDPSFWSTSSLSSLMPAAPSGGTCPYANTTLTIGAMPVNLNLADICPYLDKARAFITAFGGVVWILIVTGRKT